MWNEVITLAGSTILGGILKLASQWMENQRHMVAMLAEKQKIDQADTEAADASADKAAARDGNGGAITRRIITCTVLFTVFIAPVIVAICFPSCPVFFAYNEQATGFWSLFMSAVDKMKFVRIDGFVILPIHTQIASAIAGFYFGAGIVKSAK